MIKASSNEAGFTLVELLVSLALLSLMTVYALSAFSTLRDLNRIGDRARAQTEVDAVARHIRDSLSDIRPQYVANRDGTLRLLFAGKNDSITFVSASGGDREVGGLYTVRYRLDEGGNLIAERTLLRDGSTQAANRVVLLRNVKGISIRYWTAANDSSAGSMDSPERVDRLPNGIGLALQFGADDPRHWPATLIPINGAE